MTSQLIIDRNRKIAYLNHIRHSINLECKYCNKTFNVPNYLSNKRKYCSKECSEKGRIKPRIKSICLNCGKEFEYLPDGYCKGKYCSRNCSQESNPPPIHIGDEHPRWNPNSVNRNFYKTKYWREVSSRIINRDRKCKKCGAMNRRLTVHHINPRYNGGGESDDNLITLCVPCHNIEEEKFKNK
jgi:5-methylcytosine-specific restriction protein A